MEQDYNLKKWSKGCPNTGINCRRSSCGIEYVFIPAALGDDQKGSPVAPKNGSYNNAVVYYEATGNVYLYSSDGVPTRVEKNLDSIIAELQRELNNVEEALSEETSAREAADAAIEQEIEDLRNEPDVVDIVGTYADLQAYNTSDLGDKDIIRVLVDETHDDESTYYRWNKTPQTWTYIGAIDGYYTKTETDTLLGGKQDTLTAGDNITIDANNVISAEAGITKLTTADYNMPANNPQYVATWLLEPGLYVVDETGTQVGCSTSTHGSRSKGVVFLVAKNSDSAFTVTYGQAIGSPIIDVTNLSGAPYSGYQSVNVLIPNDIQDTLTSTSTNLPLSAKQGKVLNDKIGDLTTLQTTAKTNLVAAINELVESGASVSYYSNSELESLWEGGV